MYDECRFLVEHTAGKSEEEIINDEILWRAVIRSLEIIGEASKKISPDFAAQHPEIAWRDMGKMRDRLIHHYFGVDYQIVYATLRDDIPQLTINIEQLIKNYS
jgi:uncharacterized protein with HEPN domain